jgi:dCTP deaminase
VSVLSAQSIRQLVTKGWPLVEPFSDRNTQNGMSYGLSSAGYDIRVDNDYDIGPGQFQLAASVEHFHVRGDILGIVHDKSSWARQGLTVQNTVLEPGWKGYLTLELTNHSNNRIILHKGDPIAQIVFHWLDDATMQPYSGKYQDQEQGPQQARFEFEVPYKAEGDGW